MTRIAILKPDNIKFGNAFWFGQHPVFREFKDYGYSVTYICYEPLLQSDEVNKVYFKMSFFQKILNKILKIIRACRSTKLSDVYKSLELDQISIGNANALIYFNFFIQYYYKKYKQNQKIMWASLQKFIPDEYDIIITEGIDYDFSSLLKNYEGRIIINDSISIRKNYNRQQTKLMNQSNVSCVCVNAIVENLILSRFPNMDTHVIGHALANDTEVTYHEERKNFIVVGRLSEEKGIDIIIKAYAKLPKYTREKHKLLICGDGYLRHNLQKLCIDLKLDGHVKFLGFQSRKSVYNLMSSSIALVSHPIATTEVKEAFGMIYLEAFKCGLTCIASKLDTLESIYGDAITYVDELSIEQTTSAMKQLTTARENYAKDYTEILGQYSVKQITSEWLKVLNVD